MIKQENDKQEDSEKLKCHAKSSSTPSTNCTLIDNFQWKITGRKVSRSKEQFYRCARNPCPARKKVRYIFGKSNGKKGRAGLNLTKPLIEYINKHSCSQSNIPDPALNVSKHQNICKYSLEM